MAALATLVCALLLAGCGGAASHPRRAKGLELAQGCTPRAVATLARAVGVGVASVQARVGVGNNDEPQCELRVARQGVDVVINLDSAPQTYSRFERTVEELAQGFPVRLAAAPQNVTAGLGGAWLPAETEFLTTDGHRLITVTLHWRGARQAAIRALGIAEGRLYLGPNSKTARMEEF